MDYCPGMRRSVGFSVRVVCLLVAAPMLLASWGAASAFGAPGGLDSSFGEGGMVRLLSGNEEAYADGIATQPDGKVLVAGVKLPGSVVLIRLLPNGAPDPSFGDGGEVVTPFVGGYGGARAVAIQPDGKIVVAGGAKGGVDEDFLVARYTSSGALDTSFGGGDGIAIVPVGGEDDEAKDVTIAADGRIVAVGISDQPGSDRAVGVLVLRPDGSPDSGFAGDGSTVLTTPGGEGDDRGEAVVTTFDGRILVADSNAAGGGHGFTLIRLLANGALDSSFGTKGIVTTPIPIPGYPMSESGRVTDIALLADGRIVASGYGTDYGGEPPTYDGKVAAVRYLPDGQLDTSFADGGIFTVQLGEGNDAARAIAVAPSGKYLLAGTYIVQQSPVTIDAPAVLRLGADGQLDPTFGDGGIVRRGQTAAFGEYVENAAVDAAGRLLTIGGAYGGNNTSWISVTRYLGDPPPPLAAPTSGERGPEGRPAPHAQMKKVSGRLVTTKLRGFSGVASDAGGRLAKVQVAVVRLPSRRASASRAGRTCQALKNARARFKVVKAKRGKPCPLRWLNASGKARWRFKLKAILPPGSYVVFARAVDASGAAESSFSRAARNRYAFRLLAPQPRQR